MCASRWRRLMNRAVGNDHFCDTWKKLPKDYFVHIKGDCLVSQKWGETPSDPTTLLNRQHRSNPVPGAKLPGCSVQNIQLLVPNGQGDRGTSSKLPTNTRGLTMFYVHSENRIFRPSLIYFLSRPFRA